MFGGTGGNPAPTETSFCPRNSIILGSGIRTQCLDPPQWCWTNRQQTRVRSRLGRRDEAEASKVSSKANKTGRYLSKPNLQARLKTLSFLGSICMAFLQTSPPLPFLPTIAPEFRPGFNALGSCHWRCALDLPDGDLTPTAVTFNCSMAGGLVKSVNKGMMFRRAFLKMGIVVAIIIIIAMIPISQSFYESFDLGKYWGAPLDDPMGCTTQRLAQVNAGLWRCKPLVRCVGCGAATKRRLLLSNHLRLVQRAVLSCT